VGSQTRTLLTTLYYSHSGTLYEHKHSLVSELNKTISHSHICCLIKCFSGIK
jgi:uncharacterized phage-associated protein